MVLQGQTVVDKLAQHHRVICRCVRGPARPAATGSRPLLSDSSHRAAYPAGAFSRRRLAHQQLLPRHQQRRPGAGSAAHAAASDGAAPGDWVQVHYVGKLDDGTIFDSSQDGPPIGFVIGGGDVLPGFEATLLGLTTGQIATTRILPEDAYGEWTEELTVQMPRADAPEDMEVGVAVELSNGMTAFVTEVTDASITLDANPELAGQTLTFEVQLVDLTKGETLQQVTFGAGCFWGVELAFQRVPGVVATQVGYSQGDFTDVTYEDVCTGTTGHTEVVQVTYDPAQVGLEALLDVFFKRHDPTQLNRQGGDVGTQYRSGIYYHTPEQAQAAADYLVELNDKLGGQVVTELDGVRNYQEAEDYHQQYLAKGGRNGRAQDPSKGCIDPIRCYG